MHVTLTLSAGGTMGEKSGMNRVETGTTDHKAHIDDAHVHQVDKQKLAASDKAAKHSMIPVSGENKAKTELRARKNAQKPSEK
ncbi:MAG: hypothetical protein M3081_10935 [Gemmatimonadota bacterium]|nr:hypothetical protein [Gemmatimonadota bacterium]